MQSVLSPITITRYMDRVTSLILLLVSSLLLLPTHAVTRFTAIQSPPMVLPLYLTSVHSNNKPTLQFSRRHLHRADENRTFDARMSLYDDLLTNGYYTTKLWIGTPPQEFALIVDSGSTVTYVPCESCEQCGNHQDPRFQPDQSSTYQPVKCNIDCTCDADNTQCTYERQYAEMSSSSGVLGEDMVSFGSQSALVPQRAVFGCENSETGDLFSQHADGIMGLGRGPLSIMDQLVDKGVIGDSFSLCYGGMDIGGGAMVLGELPLPSEMVFAKSDPGRSPYYNIELKEIHVSGKPLKLKPKVFDSRHGTVLDSGTTYAYLPKEAFVAFKNAVISNLHLKQIPGPDPNFYDICFSTAGSDVSELSEIFPEVAMVFGNGQKLALSPENYLFRHSKVHDAYCLGIFQNGRDPTTLLGGIVVRNTLVTYDRSKERIGFWKTNCSELWKVLQSHGAPSSSLAPSTINQETTIGMPPSLPPTASQNRILPDQIQVALISLEISLSVKYKDLKPHMAELAESIARELRINASQVHLMNSTSILNGTLIKCSILPSGSGFISNTTAMGMISRFREHRVRLPETYGNYQLVHWKVEPSSKGSWWHRHMVGVIVGSLASVMLICSALAVWFFWRQKRELGSYVHVDSAHPEQELQLQPL